MTLMAEHRSVRFAGRGSTALRYLPVTALMIDVVLMLGAEALAVIGRPMLPLTDDNAMSPQALLVALPTIVVIWVGVLHFFGAYRAEIFGAGADEFKRVLNG